MNMNFFSAIYTTNAFLPLLLAGDAKKVISITSGTADENVILTTEVAGAVGYAVSKTAMNAMMAKYAAQYKEQGVKFLALSPGWVETEAGMYLLFE